jgi:hypothetical protein
MGERPSSGKPRSVPSRIRFHDTASRATLSPSRSVGYESTTGSTRDQRRRQQQADRPGDLFPFHL